jgi:hypothetical protein
MGLNRQNYSIKLKNLEKEILEKQPHPKMFNIFESVVKTRPISMLLSIVAILLSILAIINFPWSSKF